MTNQVRALCQSLYFEIRRVSELFTRCHCHTHGVFMVLSDIDHGNALLSDLSLDQTYTLQKLQKQEAKVILREREKKIPQSLF